MAGIGLYLTVVLAGSMVQPAAEGSLTAAQVYPTYGLNLTAIHQHPLTDSQVLATTSEGLYVLGASSCSLLVGTAAEMDKSPCNANQSLTISNITSLVDIDLFNFTYEGFDKYRDIEVAVVLTDQDQHCLYMYDMSRKSVDVFVGECGIGGLASTSYGFQTTNLWKPSTTLYENRSDTDETNRVKVYGPCQDSRNKYCCIICLLETSEKCTLSASNALAANNLPVGAYMHTNPSKSIRTNRACRVAVLHFQGYPQVSMCIASAAFISADLYYIDYDGKLLMSDLLSTYNVGQQTHMVSHVMCTRYAHRCLADGYKSLSSYRDRLLAFNEEEIILQIVMSEGRANTSHSHYSVLRNGTCHADYMSSDVTRHIEHCAYRCSRALQCLCFSYDTVSSLCKLYEVCSLEVYWEDSHRTMICYLQT